jgi:hypothetical protein
MQPSTEVQPSVMEIDMSAPRATKVRRHATIMDRTTLLYKGIHIPNLDLFMLIQIK